MATGDIIFFDEALDTAFFGGWATTDAVKLAILDNTVTPTAATATPTLATTFTTGEVTAAGTYTAGGTALAENWGALSVEAAGTLTFDSATNPTWAQDASNATDAWWGLLYNSTQAGQPAFAYVELGGPVDMTAGSLTVTWNATGIFTIAKA